MSDPISAAASSFMTPPLSQQTPQTQTLTLSAVNSAQSAQESEMAQAFQQLLNAFHLQTSGYDANGNTRLSSRKDSVQAAQASFYPQGTSSASALSSAGNGQDAAIQTLQASFDHSLFVTLVSQVISGAGQTLSTLIKQQ